MTAEQSKIIEEARIEEARAFAAQPHQLFIDGSWVNAETEAAIPTFDPSTAEQLGSVPDGSAEDIDRAVASASRCFYEDWSLRPPTERSRVLLRAAELIDQRRDLLATLETLDNGTLISIAPSYIVSRWIEVLEYFAGWTTKATGQTMPSLAGSIPPGSEAMMYTTREPIGVVGAILPWNAPGTFLINKAAPALAAGCTVVVKPAEQTPLTALYLASLFQEAGLPDGALNIVTGYGETAGAALAKHPDVRKISFTGSSAVGKQIARDGADSLKRLTLELGGKSAFVVMADANLDAAAGTAAMIGYAQAGQFCMCPSRILVEKSVVDPFVDKLKGLASNITVGRAIDPSSQMGPLISDEQRQRVTHFVDLSKQEGAELVLGGAAPGDCSDKGYFFNPTIFFHSDTRLTIAQEEVFGPVLLVVPFDGSDLDALAAVANETRYGLAASIWTRDLSVGHRMLKRFQAGIVGLNSHSVVHPMAPFGGVKDSGLGREFGQEGYESFLETKTATVMY